MNTLLEVVGLAALCAGVAFIFWPAALIVGGALLVIGANLRARGAAR